MIGRRFVHPRQHQRSRAQERAQKYLQAAVAANVVERRPNHARLGFGSAAEGACERAQRMGNQLGRPGRAGGQEHPFGLKRGSHGAYKWRRLERGPNDCLTVPAGNFGGRAVGDHGVDLGIFDDRRQLAGGDIERANHQSARDPIELDQGQGTGQLIASGNEHRAPAQLAEPATQISATDEAGQWRMAVGVPQDATGKIAGAGHLSPQRARVIACRVHRT